MSLTTLIILIIIFLVLIIIIFYNKVVNLATYFLQILNLTSLVSSEPETALSSIFYLYDHSDIKAWRQWVANQDDKTQKAAIEMLLLHINGNPGSWGLISPMAIKSLDVFVNQENKSGKAKTLISQLEETLKICKKIWTKFIIAKTMYQATWETIITMDEALAKNLITKELDVNLKDKDANPAISASLVSSFTSFDQDTDISDLFCKVLNNLKQDYKVKEQALKIMEESRTEEETFKTITMTLNHLAEHCNEKPNEDDNKIITGLLNIASKNIDDTIIKLILKICQNQYLSISCIQALEIIISNHPELFNPVTLYALISIENREIHRIIRVLAKIFHLNPVEVKLCSQDLKNTTEFKTSLLATEKLSELIVTDELQGLYKIVNNVIKTSNKSEISLMTGEGEFDKLYLARAVAAENKWTFLYAQYRDLESSEIAFGNLREKIRDNKPLLVYISQAGPMLESIDTAFLNKIKNISIDSRIKVIVSCLNSNTELNLDPKLKPYFCSTIFNLNKIEMEDKITIFKAKLDKIQAKNKAGAFDMDEIIGSLNDHSRLEFEIELIQYFKAGLLTQGKIIELGTFKELKEIGEKVGTQA